MGSGNFTFTIVERLAELADIYLDEDGGEPTMQYDVAPYMVAWSMAEDVAACVAVLTRIQEEKEVSVGDFVKAVLKIVNMVTEMEHIAESCCDVAALAQWKEIPPLLLKYIVINQSLYV
jgi:dTDP-4-dehydrorhamnose reductase